MSVVLEQLAKARKINFKELAKEAIMANEKDIVNLNRDQQRKGQKGDGDMPEYYLASYLNYKRSLDSYFAGNKTDLFLTGDFQRGMKMNKTTEGVEITSLDKKTPDLLEKYGEQIFELNTDFKSQAYEKTDQTYFKMFHDILQSK